MAFNNKFSGKILVIGGGIKDIEGQVRINYPKDLPSSVTVRARTNKDLPSTVDVKFSTHTDLLSTVRTGHSLDLPSSVRVRPHNKMSGLVEIVEPPVFTVKLSPVEDTYVRDDMPKLNYGNDHDMFVGASAGGVLYRSFLRFDIAAVPKQNTIKKATLVLGRLNSRPAIPVGIYEVPSGETWTEYGLTWDNQPGIGNLIKTYDSGIYAGTTLVDLTSFITEWYNGSRDHNGFILKSLQEEAAGLFKQYGTRESDHVPYIEIEYYDPHIFSYGKQDLPSSVFVVSAGQSDLLSSVVVQGYDGKDDLASSVTVRDPKIPVDDDLPSSVAVTRDYLPSSLFVKLRGDYDITSSVAVRVKDADDILGQVFVNKPEIVGGVHVRPYTDLDSKVSVTYKGDEDLIGTVAVNSPEINGKVEVTPYADLSSSIVVKGFNDDDLISSVAVNSPELVSQVEVPAYDDLGGSVAVRQSLDDDLVGSVAVTRPDLICSVYVGASADLKGSVTPRVKGRDEITGSVFVVSGHINSQVTVRRMLEKDLDSSLYVWGIYNEDISSSVIVRVTENDDLPSSVRVRRATETDLKGSVIPRILSADDIPSTVEVHHVYDLPSKVSVRVEGKEDLPSTVIPRVTTSDDLVSSVFIDGDEGYAFVM